MTVPYATHLDTESGKIVDVCQVLVTTTKRLRGDGPPSICVRASGWVPQASVAALWSLGLV